MMMKAIVALATCVAAEKFVYPEASLVEQAEAAQEMQTAEGRSDKEHAVLQSLSAADMVKTGAEYLERDPVEMFDEQNEAEDDDDEDSEISAMNDNEKEYERKMLELKKEENQQSIRQLAQMQKASALLNERPGEEDEQDKAKFAELQENEDKNLRSLGIKPTGSEFQGLL